MKITFLGTSAANGYPLAFCKCDNCIQARKLGGRSLRRRSSLLINEDLLIDLGPDIITGSFNAGCSLENVQYCLQTHSHADHLDLSQLEPRSPEWEVQDINTLHLYSSKATLHKIEMNIENGSCRHGLLQRKNIELHPIVLHQKFIVGDYKVAAFPANHDPHIEPLLFAIEQDGLRLFYGTDTASLTEEIWDSFHSLNLQFDVVILDHTYGSGISANDHLNADSFVEHLHRMRCERLLNNGTRVFATHISHEGNPPHQELVNLAAKHGYEIAFDGLVIQ